MLDVYYERWEHWKPPYTDHGKEIMYLVSIGHYRRRVDLMQKRRLPRAEIEPVYEIYKTLVRDLKRLRYNMRRKGEFDYVKEANAEFETLKELERVAAERVEQEAAAIAGTGT